LGVIDTKSNPTYPDGSVELWNEKPGSDYMNIITSQFTKVAWLNPQPEEQGSYFYSISLIRQLVDNKMFPLTVDGIGRAIKEIS
jgi:uncharacterized protein with von Willebrand factor type A (vWA) domain